MTRRTFANAPRAFTLLELLFAVAIVAVLAAILFPVFARAREKARQASCLSNLRQFNAALLQYVQDYDETFPQSVYGLDAFPLVPGSGNRSYTYFDAVLPYLKSEAILLCPSQDVPMDFPAILAGVGLRGAGAFRFSSYAANFALFQDPALPPALLAEDPTIPLAEIADPVHTVTFFDSRYDRPGVPRKDGCPALSPSTLLDWANFPGDSRHHDGFNVGFVDGHVRFYKANAVIPGVSPTSTGTTSTYTLPCDLCGIPGGPSNT